MRRWICLIIFCLFVLLAGCGLETKTLSEFYDKDLDDVSKIAIRDGSTGLNIVITDKTSINKLLNKVKDTKFIPDENQEERDGWRYSITLFQQDEPTFQFTLTKVDGHYYHTEPDLYPIVNEFYEKFDIQKE